MKKINLTHFLSYILILIFAALLINNNFYSFNWTDEGFYLSNIHRVFQGDMLFADDWSPTQSYEMLLYPFYTLYLKLNGSTDGVYLFFRILTCLFQALVSFFTYFILSRKWSLSPSFFASLLPLIFSRACINGPSYYVVGFETYLLGLLSLYAFFEIGFSAFFLVFAGVFLALAVLCNPYLVLPYTAISAFLLFFPHTREHWKNFLIIWISTILVAIIYVLTTFKFDRIGDVIKSIHYIFNDPAYGHTLILTIKRLYKMPRLLLFPYLLTYFPVIIASVIIIRKKITPSEKAKKWLFLLNTILFVASILTNLDCGAATMPFFHYSFFTALIFSDFNIMNLIILNKKEILYFVLPGMLLAYFFCYASDTGFGVCSIGITLADIGMISIYFKSFPNVNSISGKKITSLIHFIPACFLITVTFYYRVNLTYMDTPLSPHILFIPSAHKDAIKITEGPAKGLYTGSYLKEQYDRVLTTINNIHPKKGESLLISSICPWAHLVIPELRVSSPTTFRVKFNDYRIKPYFEDFESHNFPEYVLLLNNDIFRNNTNEFADSWLEEELSRRNYQSEKVSCGTLYKKS